MPKFLIADDHPLFREALSGALQQVFPDLNVIESDSLESTLSVLNNNLDTDLVLLDLHMPGCEDFYGLLRVAEDYPKIPIAVISASESIKVIARVMGFGAKAFIPKSTPTVQVASAIKEVLDGDEWLPEEVKQKLASSEDDDAIVANKIATLTTKQFQVLKLLQDGLLNKQIAYDLNITEATVKAHISAIFKKLSVNTRTQAVLLAEKLQLED
jgi:DNA-binding NarL/FixJ family response regulator